MAATVHFRLNKNTGTPCRKFSEDIPKNINWNKVTCRECLMMKDFVKKKRNQ